MPTLTTDEVELHYQISGQGTPLVLIGGLTTGSGIWSEMTSRLSKNFCLICPDNRGAGQTVTKLASFSIEQMANDIRLLLEHLKLEKAHIVGHSMGGMIAQSIAVYYPENVDKLIIAGSAAKIDPHALYHIKTSVDLLKSQVDLSLILKTVIPWLYADNFLLNKEKLQSEINRIINDPFAQSLEDYERQVQAIEHFDIRDHTPTISAPTLVLVGSDDVLIRQETSKEQLYHKIKGAHFDTLADCGHMFHREKPKEFCSVIEAFCC
jgi:pimeloyl-ACP methyl ester carboxylesterase